MGRFGRLGLARYVDRDRTREKRDSTEKIEGELRPRFAGPSSHAVHRREPTESKGVSHVVGARMRVMSFCDLDLLLLHAFATCAMTGLILFVQVVHDPLFARIGPREFPAYHERHAGWTALVVTPITAR